jgi:hypothetical protein
VVQDANAAHELGRIGEGQEGGGRGESQNMETGNMDQVR